MFQLERSNWPLEVELLSDGPGLSQSQGRILSLNLEASMSLNGNEELIRGPGDLLTIFVVKLRLILRLKL